MEIITPYLSAKEYMAIVEHSKIDLFSLLNNLYFYKRSDDGFDFWRMDTTLDSYSYNHEDFTLIVALPESPDSVEQDNHIPRPFVFKIEKAGKLFYDGICFFNDEESCHKYAEFTAHHPDLKDER